VEGSLEKGETKVEKPAFEAEVMNGSTTISFKLLIPFETS
jgi:hypothetical protein